MLSRSYCITTSTTTTAAASTTRRFAARLTSVVIALLFLISISYTRNNNSLVHAKKSCCESSLLQFACPECYGNCPMRSDPLGTLRNLLDKQLVGQPAAKSMIPAAFEKHNKRRALTFHFAGDNGVGKSHTTLLMSQALFVYTNADGKRLGHKYFNGATFKGISPEEIASHRDFLARETIRQLQLCPQSLIEIDEVQEMDPEVLSIMNMFIDDVPFVEYRGLTCRTNEAIFVFISDFGRRGRVKDLSQEEVIANVRRVMHAAWDETTPKISQLIQNVVPFYNFDDVSRKQLAASILNGTIPTYADFFARRRVDKVTWDDDVLNKIVVECKKQYTSCNGRAIPAIIGDLVLPTITLPSQQSYSAPAVGSGGNTRMTMAPVLLSRHVHITVNSKGQFVAKRIGSGSGSKGTEWKTPDSFGLGAEEL